MQRHLGDGEADVDLLRAGGKRGGEADGIDVGADAVEVVLGEPEHLHAERIAQLCFAQRLLDDSLIVRRVHRGRKQESAESHEALYSSRSSSAAARNRSLPYTLWLSIAVAAPASSIAATSAVRRASASAVACRGQDEAQSA